MMQIDGRTRPDYFLRHPLPVGLPSRLRWHAIDGHGTPQDVFTKLRITKQWSPLARRKDWEHLDSGSLRGPVSSLMAPASSRARWLSCRCFFSLSWAMLC